MKVDPKLRVQTVPEVQCGDRQVCCGQAARLCDASILFYTALTHGGSCWYHTVENTPAYSAADALAEGLGDVRLGFGYGLRTMSACLDKSSTDAFRLVDFDALAVSCRAPVATDSPIPVLFCEAGNRLAQPGTEADMFVVGKNARRRLAESVVPMMPLSADASYLKWLRRNAGKLYIGFRGAFSDVAAEGRKFMERPFGNGQHVMYSCPYEGEAGKNSLLHVNDHGMEVFARLFGK